MENLYVEALWGILLIALGGIFIITGLYLKEKSQTMKLNQNDVPQDLIKLAKKASFRSFTVIPFIEGYDSKIVVENNSITFYLEWDDKTMFKCEMVFEKNPFK